MVKHACIYLHIHRSVHTGDIISFFLPFFSGIEHCQEKTHEGLCEDRIPGRFHIFPTRLLFEQHQIAINRGGIQRNFQSTAIVSKFLSSSLGQKPHTASCHRRGAAAQLLKPQPKDKNKTDPMEIMFCFWGRDYPQPQNTYVSRMHICLGWLTIMPLSK